MIHVVQDKTLPSICSLSVDSLHRIQRAWRQYKGYVYFEYEDWERARVNPFSSVVPVETTSAFSSPAGPYLMGAPDDSHTDHYEDGEYEYTDDEDENVRRRDGPAGGPGDAYRLYDDWEMTPVHDREPLAIAHIEAQIQVMNMMQKAIEDHAPSSLNIEDEASEESGGEYYEDEDSEGEEDEDELEDEEEEENRYQHRSFDQKSFSALDLRHFSPAAKSEGAGKRRSLDHGPQSHAAAIMSQSVGDLYHICYDADGERISRSFSHDSKGSPECGTRRSPDGSSGNPSPTHDAAETGSHQSGRSANRVRMISLSAPFVCLSVCPLVHLSVCVSACISVCLAVCQSVCSSLSAFLLHIQTLVLLLSTFSIKEGIRDMELVDASKRLKGNSLFVLNTTSNSLVSPVATYCSRPQM